MRNRGANSGATAASLPLLVNPRLQEATLQLKQLANELDAVKLADLAEPDHEAIEHERLHQDGAQIGEMTSETERDQLHRKNLLRGLEQRLLSVREMLGLGPVQF